MTTRRKFIKTSSVVAAGAMIAPMSCNTKPQKTEATVMAEEKTEVMPKEVGVQAYSIRDALKEDFSESMKRIADIGYKYIEAYGLGTDGKILGMTPADYKKVVSDLGMELISSHATYFTPQDAPSIIET
jgi:hypothetical protein